MANKIIKREKSATHPVPAVFEHLGITQVAPADRFTLNYRDGLLEARVKRESGRTETAMMYVKGNGFQQMTSFDPSKMTKDERNDLIRTMYARGETQEALAQIFGLTQAMISRIANG